MTDNRIFVLGPDPSTGDPGDRILTHGLDDLAERVAAAKRDGRTYSISEASE